MEKIKENYKPKNLRTGCHFFNKDMKLDVYVGYPSDEMYLIPLNKHILAPLKFEDVYDEYTSELYFQRDYEGCRIRVFPMDGSIQIIDLKYLHTLVHVKAESLNELENFLYALDIPVLNLFDAIAMMGINKFGSMYWDYYEQHNKMLEEMDKRFKIDVEDDTDK